MQYFAHSTADKSMADWQPLAEHLREVAELAAGFGAPLGIANAARLAGLLHDLGKYSEAFQRYIRRSGESVDHSTAGAAIAAGRATGDDKLIAEMVSYVVAGHHAGLPDMGGASVSSLAERLKGFDPASIDPAWQHEVTPDATGLVPSLDWQRDKQRAAFQLALLGRMLFSCLVDAGAWIETRWCRTPAPRRRVAPRVGAWIETHYRNPEPKTVVAPHMFLSKSSYSGRAGIGLMGDDFCLGCYPTARPGTMPLLTTGPRGS